MSAGKFIGKALLGLLGLVVLLVVILALLPPHKRSTSIDFTRHLGLYELENTAPQPLEDEFFGVPGEARLIVSSVGASSGASITLNGVPVLAPGELDGGQSIEVPVQLVANNTLVVTLGGSESVVPGGAAGEAIIVRVRQTAEIEMHVASRIHFNTNVSDFTQARSFYGKLGFGTLTGFPDNNTLEMAQAIGIDTPTSYDGSEGGSAGGYLLHGELIGLSGFAGGVIDLIEFTIPRNLEPPYAKINHLGMAKATMYTRDIGADYEYMSGIGVEFIAAPTAGADGSLFAIFKDLDGTHYELREVAGEPGDTETTQIASLGHLNVNVSDFERSKAWYQMIGYELTEYLAETETIGVSNALGFEQIVRRKGAILTHENDGSTIELVQWLAPYDPEPPYGLPINHLGIHRTAFTSGNIEADVATLKSQGVEFVSDITACCSGNDSGGSIVAFYDPDGTLVELVGQPRIMSNLFAVIAKIM